jgi:hypothetical protein
MADALLPQGLETIAKNWTGELQVAVLQGHTDEAMAQLVGEGGEFIHRQAVAAAVAAHQHAKRAVGSRQLGGDGTGWGGGHDGLHLP